MPESSQFQVNLEKAHCGGCVVVEQRFLTPSLQSFFLQFSEPAVAVFPPEQRPFFDRLPQVVEVMSLLIGYIRSQEVQRRRGRSYETLCFRCSPRQYDTLAVDYSILGCLDWRSVVVFVALFGLADVWGECQAPLPGLWTIEAYEPIVRFYAPNIRGFQILKNHTDMDTLYTGFQHDFRNARV